MLLFRPNTLIFSTGKNLKNKIYKTIILSVVLNECGTWYLTLREECNLRVFENRIPKRIFRPKRSENGEWKSLHNEELHSFYCSARSRWTKCQHS